MKDKKQRTHTGELPDVSFISNPKVLHEHTDVRVKPILKFGLYLFVGAVLVHVLMWGLFHLFEKRAEMSDPPPSPLASERQMDPPEPRLQLIPSHPMHPLVEWKEVLTEQEKALKSYGWVDPKAGTVRLPIDEAKKLLLERNLLQGSQGAGRAASEHEVETLPSDPSSGRQPERRHP